MATDPTQAEQITALLLRRRAELQNRAERVDRDLSRANQPLEQDSGERAVQLQNDETLTAIATSARDELQAIERALLRLKQGTYGECRTCKRPIEPKRLQVIPYADTCGSCSQPAR